MLDKVVKHKEVLTTGEVARICHVAPRTVSKWFDTGKLRGYRIPGSRDRRIPFQQLVSFMRCHGMPTMELEGNVIRVLIVDSDRAASAAVAESLVRTERYEVAAAANDFEAGVLAGRFCPHVMLIDVLASNMDSAEMLRNLRENADLAGTKVVAVTGELTRAQRDALVRQGFDLTLPRPFQVPDLVRVIEEATDLIS